MSVEVSTLVWKSDIERNGKFILLCLADFSNDEGASIYPSLNYICWKTGYSETQARDILQQLTADGIISVDIQGSKYGTNNYTINLDRLPVRPPYKAPSRGRPTLTNKIGAETVPVDKMGAETEPIYPKMGAETGKVGAVFGEVGTKTEPDTLVNTLVKTSEELKEAGGGKDLMNGIIHYEKIGQANNRIAGISEFPEEVQAVIERFCQLWKVTPPPKWESAFDLWIQDGRLLIQAGGAEVIETLESLDAKPFKWQDGAYVGRPGGLIKAVRARAGEIRRERQGNAGGWTPEEREATEAKIRELKAARNKGGFAPSAA
jgi:hypothetical protein